MRIALRTLLLLFALLHAGNLLAAACSSVFPAALTGSSANSLNLTGVVWQSSPLLGASNRSLSAGSHYFGGGSTANGWTLSATGGASTRVFVNGSLALGNNNLLNAGGNPQDLILVVNGSLSVPNNAQINGFVYVTGSISLGNNLTLNGAITSIGGQSIGSNSSQTYAGSSISQADFASLCTDTEARQLYLRFDEASWNGTANEVRDSTSNGNDGRGLNAQPASATPALSGNGGTCGYGSFATSSSRVEVPHDSTLDFSSDLSAGLWIRPTVAPIGADVVLLGKGTNYQLALNSSRQLVLTALIAGFGSTTLSLTSSSALPLNTWSHVGFSLELNNGFFFFNSLLGKLFINGVAAGSGQSSTIWFGGPSTNTATLLLGGNGSSGLSGLMDEVRLDQSLLTASDFAAQMAARHSCSSSGPDHFEFSYASSTGLTCNPLAVTLRACQNASCSSTYGSSVTTTLSPANGWVGGNSPVINGSANLTLQVTAVSAVALAVSGSPAATNATQCVVGGVVSSCNLSFVDSGFIIDVPNLLAAKPSGGTIKAVRKDAVTQACVPGFASGTRTVKFSSAYANPNMGTKQVVVNGSSVGGALSDVTLSFDAAASAPLTVRYDDAGQMTLNASFTGAGGEAGLLLTGSDQFVARPAGLCVYSDSANSDCASGDASCSAFVRAGDNFRLGVKGAAWESDADTNFCSGNGSTPNYRQSGIALSSSLIAPAGGAVASLGVTSVDILAADAGEKILTNQTVSEVGVFTFTATPAASYLGGPAVGDSDGDGVIDKLSTSANIGRFYPASFLLSDPILTPACNSGFTYAGLAAQVSPPVQPVKTGQPFGFSGALSARNLGGAVTRNYTGSFAKLTGAGMSYADSAAVSAGTVSASSTTLTVPGVGGSGYLDYSANAATFLLSSAIAPYSLAIRTTALDSDGVTGSLTDTVGSATDILAGSPLADFRLGQARIRNAHGSELQALRLPITVGHFNGAGYVQNSLDSCTAFDPANLGIYQRSNGNNPAAPVILTYLNSTGGAVAPYVLSAGSSLAGGYLLSAPGAGNDGSVRLTYTTPTWLQFDWDADGVLDNASGLATFGIYQGAQPLIFRRELYRSP